VSFVSLVQRLGHRRWFSSFGRAVVPPVDRFVIWLTKGRVVALGLIPSLVLTTTGRRSGQPRTTPLSYAPDGVSYVVIGSNWGQPDHPGWSANLLAHPDATVVVRGERVGVRATLVEGAERDRLRALLVEVWPAYATYERRAAHRQLRIFRLDRIG
jgi:deazaflavin-dependent oxidoreductase (nitroreductase family)